MKKITFLISFLSCIVAMAQTTEKEDHLKKQTHDTIPDGWRTGGVFGANFSQVSLNNWAAGGQSSISFNSLMSLFAHYKKGKNTWDNYLDLGYGLVKQGDGDFIKSDDKIEFTSKYGRKATEHWFYAGLANFRSQFSPGYNFPNDSVKISDFMAPGYFLGALGMDYRREEKLTFFISPITAKVTVVNDQTLADAGAFGVDEAEYDAVTGVKIKDGSSVRTEFGGYLRLMYTTEVVKNVTFLTNLNMFSNYAEDPDHIDVNWDNLLTMKVNDFISASFSTSLIYDHDIDIQELNNDGSSKLNADGNPIIGPRTQFKYVLAVGFQYRFGVEDNR